MVPHKAHNLGTHVRIVLPQQAFMKLLLTSAGLSNETIAKTLEELVGKSPSETKVAVVTTAANVEVGNKDWFIRQFTNLHSHGYVWTDAVDISAADVDWKSRLSNADVILVGGGNTFHLLNQARRTGFGEWLAGPIGSKVYVGISAGSILVTPSVAIAGIDNGDVNHVGLTDLSGLGLVDFEVSPHTPENVSHEGNAAYRSTIENALYELDDNSAVAVDDRKVNVVSEGVWKVL